MYLRYIYKLHDLHIPAGSYTEAAFTLKLHANDLSWSNRPLHSDLRYTLVHELMFFLSLFCYKTV